MVLAEILPICEYLEEIHPSPPLVGSNAEERAVTRMWARRVDLAIVEPLTNGFRFAEGLALFQNRVRCIPQAADDLKTIAREKLVWLDGLIGGRKYIVGDRFTLADIHLWVFLDFAAQVGQALDPANKNLTAWMARVGERPSVAAPAPPPVSPVRSSPLREGVRLLPRGSVASEPRCGEATVGKLVTLTSGGALLKSRTAPGSAEIRAGEGL